MTTQFIEHKGKKYPIKEPTIKVWADVMKLQGILDEAPFPPDTVLDNLLDVTMSSSQREELTRILAIISNN